MKFETCKLEDLPKGRREYNAAAILDKLLEIDDDEALIINIPKGEIESHWINGLRSTLNNSCAQRALDFSVSIRREGRKAYLRRKSTSRKISLKAIRIVAYLLNTDWSLARIGEECGVSRQRVSQFHIMAKGCGIKFPNRDGKEELE